MSNEKTLDKQDATEVKNYTRTPNMLIYGYHDEVSPQEKWLYVCLKHMCGKAGTRHLSLRYIAEQTGISVGALSRSKDKNGKVNEGMMKHLHDAGLIHSEIKKHNGQGNALYHITITDVWGLNQSFFENRPKSEQACPNSGQDEEEPVRNLNKPVRNSDVSCPKSEQACPNSGTILILDNKTITKTIKQDKKDAASADAGASALPVSQKNEDKPERKPRTTKPKAETKAISPEALSIMDAWDSLFKRPYPRTDKHVEAAGMLVSYQPTRDDLKAVKDFIFASNPWYRDKGVTLLDVAKNIGKWQSLQDIAVEPVPKPGGYVIDEERNARNKARLHEEAEKIRAARAAGLAQQKPQEAHYAISR